MTSYTATIRHHSIARARVIEIDGTLAQAKAAASREFGDDFSDYAIVVSEQRDGCAPEIVASRRIGSRKWVDRA